MPFKANPPRRHHIPRQRHRVRKPGDQFIYSDLAITMAPTLRAAFPPPLRQTEGLIGSIVQLVGLAVPDHYTISWRAKTVRPPTTVTSSDGAVRSRRVAGQKARNPEPTRLEEAACRTGCLHRADRGGHKAVA
jgi:hypothetical protein